MIRRLVLRIPDARWFIHGFLTLFLLFSPISGFAEDNGMTLQQAILKTIEINAGIKSHQSTVQQQEGIVQSAQGEFDWYLFGDASREEAKSPIPEADQIHIGYGRIIDETRETTVLYSAGASKKFRSGFTITPSVVTADYKNNTDRPDPINQSNVSIEFVLPLMRGAGEDYTVAGERSAQSRLAATQFLAVYNISNQIFTTANAFWNCLAASIQNDIIAESQQRAKEIFHRIERLVNGGEIEPAILRQARAELYDRQAERVEGQQSLQSSRFSLAAAIGYSPQETASPPLADGMFPTDAPAAPTTEEIATGYVRYALAQRGDYLAARKTVEAEKILLQKAESETGPRVDFTLQTGYAGLDESSGLGRYANSLSNNVTGFNAYTGIRVELPLRNDAAWGEIRTRRATVRKAELDAEQLANRLASQIRISMTVLTAAAEKVALAGNAAEEYRQVLDHMGQKVRAGEASLTDLIDLEDRYLEARLKKIEALRDYAVAVARLRFETGSLLTRESDHLRVEISDLTKLPPR